MVPCNLCGFHDYGRSRSSLEGLRVSLKDLADISDVDSILDTLLLDRTVQLKRSVILLSQGTASVSWRISWRIS
jgi:hypothetical protein